MDIDKMKRAAIRIRGGVGNAPKTRWFDTRDGQPEIVDVGSEATTYTVYIPQQPQYDTLSNAVALWAHTYATTIQIVDRVEVDVSDPLHPIINIYGYRRVYRARVWMTDDEASAGSEA